MCDCLDCPVSGCPDSSTISTDTSTTPSGGDGGDGDGGDGGTDGTGTSTVGQFDWLPVILTTSIIGGLLLIALFIWCVCCLARSRERPQKYPPPALLAPPMITAPAFIGAAAPSVFAPFPQAEPTFIAAPSIMTTGPYIQEPVSNLLAIDSGNIVAPAPPKIKAFSKKRPKISRTSNAIQGRPTSILRKKPQTEIILANESSGDPVYYSQSGNSPSVRYAGTLINAPINGSIRRSFRSGPEYINAEIFPDNV